MFSIVTDSCCDLRPEYVAAQKDLYVVPQIYTIGSESFVDAPGQGLEPVEFYRRLSEGAVSTTSQVNTNTVVELVRPMLVEGKEVLSISLSSGLSGSFQSVKLAKEMLDAENLPGTFRIVDSLSASGGEGMLVYLALQKRAEGLALEQTARWLEDTRLKVAHWFSVDDLHFLKRGGRCSPAQAFLGTLMSIKPVLHVDNEGKLIARDKVRHRSAALRALVDHMEASAVNPKEQMVFISSAVCDEDAAQVRKMVHERLGVPMDRFMMCNCGPTVGSHSGPGTIALFFLARDRG